MKWLRADFSYLMYCGIHYMCIVSLLLLPFDGKIALIFNILRITCRVGRRVQFLASLGWDGYFLCVLPVVQDSISARCPNWRNRWLSPHQTDGLGMQGQACSTVWYLTLVYRRRQQGIAHQLARCRNCRKDLQARRLENESPCYGIGSEQATIWDLLKESLFDSAAVSRLTFWSKIPSWYDGLCIWLGFSQADLRPCLLSWLMLPKA